MVGVLQLARADQLEPVLAREERLGVVARLATLDVEMEVGIDLGSEFSGDMDTEAAFFRAGKAMDAEIAETAEVVGVE